MMRMITIMLAVLMLAYPASAEEPAAEIMVRVVQPTGAGRVATDTAEAVTPQRLTETADGMTVYTAPAGKALRLDGRVLPPTQAEAGQEASKVDDGGPEMVLEQPGAWEEVAGPRIRCLAGKAAQVRVGAQIAYMQRRDDGSLVVKHLDEVEGLEIDVTVGAVTESAVELQPLSVKLTRVVGREPMEGVPFDVGRPIVKTLSVASAFRVGADTVVIIAMPRKDGERPVYVLVRAKEVRT